MMSTNLASWTSRVLHQGTLGISPKADWKLEAYEQYKAKLDAHDYPCFFGQSGEARREMLYAFIPHHSLSEMLTSMQHFVHLIATPDYKRCSLVAFFQPDASITTHSSFVARFWHVLQYLHDHDADPSTHRTPDHPLWEFSFQRNVMFVVGTSPTYRQRRSRNLGPGIVLIFQPRSLFIDPTTSKPIAVPVRKSIHKRMLAYDGMPVHPDIGFYGEPNNREWKQYALPDDNQPETGTCPFHIEQMTSL
jgi:FPC/CPF motif-containing protein YcgG